MIRGSFHSIIVLLILSVSFIGCRKKDEARLELEHIDSLATNGQHRRALELLDSIDHRSLSEPNQNLYDLLVIKARDKDFQQHRSNNVILRLVDYYRDHPDEWNFAEVLYYGGRVHLDMGDLPSALRYFQEALDCLEDSKDNLLLQELLNGQMADIYNRMRLYDSALPYIDKAIKLSKEIDDTLGYVCHLELKGAILLHLDSLKDSKKIFKETIKLAKSLSDQSLVPRQQMYLSSTEYKLKNYKEAYKLIRPIPSKIERAALGTALGLASDIYLSVGKIDSAYIYATALANLNGNNNQKKGYSMLLSNDMITKVPKDSLLPFIRNYSKILENFVSQNADECARIQHTYYNYINWEKKYEETQNQLKFNKYILGSVILFCIFILICFGIFIKRYHEKKKSLILISQKLELTRKIFENPQGLHQPDTLNEDIIKNEQQNILRNSIIKRLTDGNFSKEVSLGIRESTFYNNLLEQLNYKKRLSNINEIWTNLEVLVNQTSPKFTHFLTILNGKKIEEDYYHLALAIKCGIPPKQCAFLFYIEPSTITYRRKILASMLFGKNFLLKDLDDAILLI